MTDAEIKIFKTALDNLYTEFQRPAWQTSPLAASVKTILAILDNLNDRVIELERRQGLT